MFANNNIVIFFKSRYVHYGNESLVLQATMNTLDFVGHFSTSAMYKRQPTDKYEPFTPLKRFIKMATATYIHNHSTGVSKQPTWYTIRGAFYHVRCIMNKRVHCTLYAVHCTLYNIPYTCTTYTHDAYPWLRNALCYISRSWFCKLYLWKYWSIEFINYIFNSIECISFNISQIFDSVYCPLNVYYLQCYYYLSW